MDHLRCLTSCPHVLMGLWMPFQTALNQELVFKQMFGLGLRSRYIIFTFHRTTERSSNAANGYYCLWVNRACCKAAEASQSEFGSAIDMKGLLWTRANIQQIHINGDRSKGQLCKQEINGRVHEELLINGSIWQTFAVIKGTTLLDIVDSFTTVIYSWVNG